MSIVKEKPHLDPVSKAQPGASGQDIKQKDIHDGVFKIYSCLKEFETANFETLNPAEGSLLNFFNQLTESHSVVTGRATELCSCPEAPESRN